MMDTDPVRPSHSTQLVRYFYPGFTEYVMVHACTVYTYAHVRVHVLFHTFAMGMGGENFLLANISGHTAVLLFLSQIDLF